MPKRNAGAEVSEDHLLHVATTLGVDDPHRRDHRSVGTGIVRPGRADLRRGYRFIAHAHDRSLSQHRAVRYRTSAGEVADSTRRRGLMRRRACDRLPYHRPVPSHPKLHDRRLRMRHVSLTIWLPTVSLPDRLLSEILP